VLWSLAVLLSDLLRYDESEKYFRRSMDVSESWAGPKDRFVADCLWGLSKCLTNNGKFLEAESAIKRAIAIYETLPENCDEYLCTNYANLGALHLQRGSFESACQHLTKAVTMRRSLAGDMDAGLISLTSKLALALMQLKRLKEAEKYLRMSLKISLAIYGDKDLESARKYIALGNCLNGLAKYPQAEKALTKAIVVVRAQTTDPALTAACLYELSTSYQKLNEKAKMKKVLEELAELYSQPHTKLPKHTLYADAQLKLGAMYEEACLFKKARVCYEGALTARESVFGQEHKLVAECLMRLGGCLTKMSQHGEAQELYRKAETMLADLKKRA
jgi:tetratricopeptide (TPR) repeat protein